MNKFVFSYKTIVVHRGSIGFRMIYMWLSWSIIGILFYRIERGFYLTFGKTYRFIRILFLPLLALIQSLSHIDINYHADIKGGLVILHYTMGVVINGGAIIGNNLILTGGNIIGAKAKFQKGEYLIGNNCMLGANAVIIGPLKIGNNVTIGASACVTKDMPSNVTIAGVPAKIIDIKE